MSFKFNALNGVLDVQSSSTTPQVTTIYFGDPNTNGTWRIVVSAGNLSFQLRESGTYNEKSNVSP